MINMTFLNNVVDFITDSVKEFEGQRQYLSTGNLERDKIISTETVTFSNKPSRANLNVISGDIIIARMQGTNKVLQITQKEESLIVSTGFVVFRPDSSLVDSRYLYHLFLSDWFNNEKDKLCSGATQKAINNTSLKKVKIPIPKLEEQKQIAEILDKSASLIESRKQSLLKLESFLKSSFLYTVGPNSKDESKWKEFKIEELALNKKGSMRTGPFGSDLRHSEFVDCGISVLGIDNAVNNHFSWDERRYITEEKYEKLKRYTVYPDDVIITIMGTTGRSAVIPHNILIAISTKHLASITLNKELALPQFISYAIHSHPGILKQINLQNKGAIMNGLNLGIIKDLKLKVPPIELQNTFKTIYETVERKRKEMKKSEELLESVHNSLLQRAFKGELTKQEVR